MNTRRIALQTATLFAAAAALIGAPSAHAATGGPDWYGYTWQDNNSGGPAYNYEFASNSTSLTAEDSQVVTLPFTFEFYGASYTSARIQSNGVLTFGTSSTISSSNTCMSSANFTGIAPWWDDLDPSAGTIYYGVQGATGSRVYIVEWYGIEHDSATGSISFEIKLFEADNHIELHYSDVTTDSSSYSAGASASVGITDWGGAAVSCNSASLSANYAVGFYPPTGGGCDDADFDGYLDDSCGGTDCNDLDSSVYPGAPEYCDFLDNDCDFDVDEDFDSDADGWSTCNGDCDDFDSGTNPNATDSCDGDDNDCDGTVDEGHDQDVDGWTWCEGDCDDSMATVNPGQWEDSSTTCFDGYDNDCDGWYDLDDTECSDFVGDDDDATGDDDDATGDDDDATGDDDDATGDDDDATGDDDDATGDDDDATGDDDDSASGDDDDDDDDGGRGGGGSRGGRGCDQGGAPASLPTIALLLSILTGLGLRREGRK